MRSRASIPKGFRVNRAVTPTDDELREEGTGGAACVAAADKPSKAKAYQLGGQQSYKITGRQSSDREPFRVLYKFFVI